MNKQDKILPPGKVPPNAVDIEEAVIGICLSNKEAPDIVFEHIKDASAIYNPQNQEIFKVIQDLYSRSQKIDLLIVANELKKNGALERAGGDHYLIQLTQKVSSTAHLERYCVIILEAFYKRELIKLSGETIHNLYEETDVFEQMEAIQSKLDQLNNFISTEGISPDASDLHAAYEDLKANIERISELSGDVTGVPTGLKGLDKITSGWQPTDFIIIGARPGMGKTALLIRNARAAAMAGYPVGVFSLEMNRIQLMARWVANETSLHTSQMLRTGFEKNQYHETLLNQQIKDESLIVKMDDTPSVDLFSFKMKAKRMVREFGVKVIFIDYLQLMSYGGKGIDKNTEYEEISKGIKAVAKELNIPIIALAQLSRDVEKRGGAKRPLLSDLRDSGGIEQNADLVTFIYRPEYYGQQMDPDHGFDVNTELIVAKHRNGAIGTVSCWFDPNRTSFQDKKNTYDNSY